MENLKDLIYFINNIDDINNSVNLVKNKIELYELAIKLNEKCKYSKINNKNYQKCEWSINDLDYERINCRDYCHLVDPSDSGFYRYEMCFMCEKILNEYLF